MITVEGSYLVWARPDKCYVLIGLNVNLEHAKQIAESYANNQYPQGWYWQGTNIFPADAGSGAVMASIIIVDSLADVDR